MPLPDAAQGIEAAQADETRSGSAVGESPTRRDAPPSPPPPPEGLPEEIVKAIATMVGLDRALGMAIAGAAMSKKEVSIKPGLDRCNEARSALTATILQHLSAANEWAEGATEACDKAYIALTAVEDERDAARARAERAEKALRGLDSWIWDEPGMSEGQGGWRAYIAKVLSEAPAGRAALSQGEETECPQKL